MLKEIVAKSIGIDEHKVTLLQFDVRGVAIFRAVGLLQDLPGNQKITDWISNLNFHAFTSQFVNLIEYSFWKIDFKCKQMLRGSLVNVLLQ